MAPSDPNSERIARRSGDIENLRKVLGCRGERIYLARIRPGSVYITPATLDDASPGWKEYRAGTAPAETFVSRLAFGLHDEGESQHATSRSRRCSSCWTKLPMSW